MENIWVLGLLQRLNSFVSLEIQFFLSTGNAEQSKYCIFFRMNALRSVKNVLSMARRRSDDEDEERNLYGTSMESEITTDGEGGGETEVEDGGAERTHDGERFGFIFFSAFF